MTATFQQNREADSLDRQTACPSPPRDRVLKVACELFANRGFHGTHLREICKRAGTNVAGVCYHFHTKEGLYEAVMMEAGRWLSNHDEKLAVPGNLSAERRLLRLTESLLERLSSKGAWIAKLLARELVDPACGARIHVASGLERYFVLLQSALRQLHGDNSEAIRLHTLSLISECVFYSLAGENLEHPLIQLAAPLPNRARLARLITQRSLASLDNVPARNQSEAPSANFS